MKQFPSPEELKGTVMGTLLYMVLYVLFLQLQSYSKLYLMAQKRKEKKKMDDIASSSLTSTQHSKVSFKKIKYYNNDDKLAIIGDRTVGNFVEFAWFFLSLLWIHALFVDPTKSFRLAASYTFCRSYYPFVFAKGAPSLLFSTVPNYGVLTYMMYEIVTKFLLA
jgi:hypothetical protein